MRLGNIFTLLGLATLPLATPWLDEAVGQDAKPATERRRPAAVIEVAGDDGSAVKRQVQQWIEQLGSKDADQREAAAKALAGQGEAARAALEDARKSGDAEVRFSAAQLLDRLDEEQTARTRSRSSVGGMLRDSGEPPAGATRRRATSRIVTGDDAASEADDAADDAPRNDRRRALRTMPHLFDDQRLQELHQRMVERMQELFDGEDPFAPFFKLGPDGADHGLIQIGPGSSFSRVVEQDGQRQKTEIKVDEDGHVKAVVEKDGAVETYEADSVEALQADHPELLEGFGQVRVGRHDPAEQLPSRSSPKMVGPRLRRAQRDVPAEPPTIVPPGPRELLGPVANGPRLGIRVEPLDVKVAEYLELDAGVGLRVIEVEPGSAAEEIGVLKNDVVIEVNGRTIRGVADVQAALQKGKPAEADLIVFRKGQRLEL